MLAQSYRDGGKQPAATTCSEAAATCRVACSPRGDLHIATAGTLDAKQCNGVSCGSADARCYARCCWVVRCGTLHRCVCAAQAEVAAAPAAALVAAAWWCVEVGRLLPAIARLQRARSMRCSTCTNAGQQRRPWPGDVRMSHTRSSSWKGTEFLLLGTRLLPPRRLTTCAVAGLCSTQKRTIYGGANCMAVACCIAVEPAQSG